jgi:hypothetical protein
MQASYEENEPTLDEDPSAMPRTDKRQRRTRAIDIDSSGASAASEIYPTEATTGSSPSPLTWMEITVCEFSCNW